MVIPELLGDNENLVAAGASLVIEVHNRYPETLVTACYATEEDIHSYGADCRELDGVPRVMDIAHVLSDDDGDAMLALDIDAGMAPGSGPYGIIIAWTNPGPDVGGSHREVRWFHIEGDAQAADPNDA